MDKLKDTYFDALAESVSDGVRPNIRLRGGAFAPEKLTLKLIPEEITMLKNIKPGFDPTQLDVVGEIIVRKMGELKSQILGMMLRKESFTQEETKRLTMRIRNEIGFQSLLEVLWDDVSIGVIRHEYPIMTAQERSFSLAFIPTI